MLLPIKQHELLSTSSLTASNLGLMTSHSVSNQNQVNVSKDGLSKKVILTTPEQRKNNSNPNPTVTSSSSSGSVASEKPPGLGLGPVKINICYKGKKIYDMISKTSSSPLKNSSSVTATATADNNVNNSLTNDKMNGSDNSALKRSLKNKPFWEDVVRRTTPADKMDTVWSNIFGPTEAEADKDDSKPCRSLSYSNYTPDVKPDVNQLKRHNNQDRNGKGFATTTTATSPPGKTKPARKSKQILAVYKAAMPNLLKTIEINGHGHPPAGGKASSRTKVDECSALSVYNNDSCYMPPDNVFLRKYDPIKLLGRLRASLPPPSTSQTTVPESPKKVFMCQSQRFPQNSSTPTSPIKACPAKVKVENGRQDWSNETGMRCSRRRAAGVIMRRRKGPVSIHCKAYRKRTLWYTCDNKKGMSDERMRLLAAVYLKRGLEKVRKPANVKQESTMNGISQQSQTPHTGVRQGPVKSEKSDLNSKVKVEDVHNGEVCCTDNPVTNVTLPPPVPRMKKEFLIQENPAIIHTISLLRHKRELQDRMETMESDGTCYKLGPTPDRMEESNRGVGVWPTTTVPLKSREAKHILSERLFVSLVQAGFTHTKLRPLEVLADVLADFLSKTAIKLKRVAELESLGVDHGFPDPAERVFTELGMGGFRGLEEFYRLDVLQYEKRMEEQCHSFRRQFAHKVRSTVGVTNSTTSSTDGTGGTNGVTGNCSRTVAMISTSNAGSNSTTVTPSIPLSPENSVLAEILSSQEQCQSQAKTLQASSPSSMAQSNGMEKKSMGTPPPNVVIRPNMIFSNSPQHTQLVLQTLNSLQSPPTRTSQPHLTELLQRPFNTNQQLSSKKTLNYIHQQSSHGAQLGGQFQGMMQANQVQPATPSTPSPAGSQGPNSPASNNMNRLLINVNSSKMTIPSPAMLSEHQAVHFSSESGSKGSTNKTLTLVRSNSSRLSVSSDRQLFQNTHHPNSNSTVTNSNSGMDLYSSLTSQMHASPSVMHHHPRQNNNVISINLGGLTNIDLDNSISGGGSGGMQDDVVTMHAAESVSQQQNFPPTVKLKDVGNQRNNLLRLNFEQAPSAGGDSTVLLSSSPANQSDTNDNSFVPIQFF